MSQVGTIQDVNLRHFHKPADRAVIPILAITCGNSLKSTFCKDSEKQSVAENPSSVGA